MLGESRGVVAAADGVSFGATTIGCQCRIRIYVARMLNGGCQRCGDVTGTRCGSSRRAPAAFDGRHRLALPGTHADTSTPRTSAPSSRSAALFQLAADIPAPVLAELLGINNDASDWARLASLGWRGYIAECAH